MAEFPAMPLWTDAYLADTGHLSTLEHGAYFLLLVTMWRSKDQTLPDDDKMLARYSRLSLRQWLRIKPTIMGFLQHDSAGRLFQGRLHDEFANVRQRSNAARRNSQSRWLKNKQNGAADGSNQKNLFDATKSKSITKTISDSDSVKESEAFGVKEDKKTVAQQQAHTEPGKLANLSAQELLVQVKYMGHKTAPIFYQGWLKKHDAAAVNELILTALVENYDGNWLKDAVAQLPLHESAKKELSQNEQATEDAEDRILAAKFQRENGYRATRFQQAKRLYEKGLIDPATAARNGYHPPENAPPAGDE